MTTPRNRGEHEDSAYLAFLREQACRAPGVPRHPGQDAHHLRHTATGASMGAHVKDDRRALSTCRGHHQDIELGQGPWLHWTRAAIKAWENEQASAQRAEYDAYLKTMAQREQFSLQTGANHILKF